jgi:hypothetical protein
MWIALGFQKCDEALTSSAQPRVHSIDSSAHGLTDFGRGHVFELGHHEDRTAIWIE